MELDLARARRIYEILKGSVEERPVAVTAKGQGGDIIGVTVSPAEMRGLIVLFTEPPGEPGKRVVLLDYEERESRKGKKYIRCFLWAEEERVPELLEECRRILVEGKVGEALTRFPVEYHELVKSLLRGEVPEELPEDVDLVALDGVPLSSPDQELYVAVCARGTVYEYGWSSNPTVYSSRYVTLVDPGIEVAIPGAKVYALCEGRVKVWAFEERLARIARALRRLQELPLSEEHKALVARRLVELARRGGGEAVEQVAPQVEVPA